ncbi:MAG TPA: hypothetical protein VE986_10075 [Hyphomicrobiales bacterium]|nr:hypothetical protein [Hyphomicrobiales bacterium]
MATTDLSVPRDHLTQKSPAGPPNIRLLQATLGELATAGHLKAENVFASFIESALSGAALKQGDIATYAQGALLELALFNAAFLRSSTTRISNLGIRGGHLRNYVAKSKAALFQQDDNVLWQVAREMVTGMRLYYAKALAHAGLSDTAVSERLGAAFGKEGAIANEAIGILRDEEPEKGKAPSPLRLLLRRALD